MKFFRERKRKKKWKRTERASTSEVILIPICTCIQLHFYMPAIHLHSHIICLQLQGWHWEDISHHCYDTMSVSREFMANLLLTHWGRVMHICVSKLTIIGLDNGLLPGWQQAIIWTIAGLLSIIPLGTNFSEILIWIQTFSFKEMHLKVASAKWKPFCLGLNVLNQLILLVTCTLAHWGSNKMVAFYTYHFQMWIFLLHFGLNLTKICSQWAYQH